MLNNLFREKHILTMTFSAFLPPVDFISITVHC